MSITSGRRSTRLHLCFAACPLRKTLPSTQSQKRHPPLDWRSASAMTPAAARMLPLLQRARSSSMAVSISSVIACGREAGSTPEGDNLPPG